MSNLYIVYHCYCAENWQAVVASQFQYLRSESIVCTVVGDAHQVFELNAIAKRFEITLECYMFSDPSIYEHEAMLKVREIAQQDTEGYTLYFHSKGTGNANQYSTAWRNYMNFHVLKDFQKVFQNLVASKKDATGVLYGRKYFDQYFFWRTNRFFGGNYWIVSNAYFSRLPDYQKLRKKFSNHRLLAEKYIGWNSPKVCYIHQDQTMRVKGKNGIIRKIVSLDPLDWS